MKKSIVGGIVLWLLCQIDLYGTHIVGGELYYECIDASNYTYRVTLRMLRDCFTGEADFDDPVTLFVIPSNNPSNTTYYQIPKPSQTPRIQPDGLEVCVGNSYSICVEEALYTTVIQLPPIRGGYDIGWARCCRNQNITNLQNPLDLGMTFTAHIPGSEDATCNSMPIFNNKLPVFICAGETFQFDFSATDVDGDSLVYSFTQPYHSLNTSGAGAGNSAPNALPPIVNPVNFMGPPPYQLVTYNGPGFSAQNPFGLNSSSIDSRSGYLTLTPPQAGIFVVAISVFEYRNGKLLSENKIDLQIHVVNCLPFDPPPTITHQFQGLNSVGDTIYVNALENFCYQVQVSDTDIAENLFAVGFSPSFSNTFPKPQITLSGGNPLNLDVCWTPSCNLIGQQIPLVIQAWDSRDCPPYNRVYDTVYVYIQVPPNPPPVVRQRRNGILLAQTDTLQINLHDTLCFNFVVDDTSSGESLDYKYDIQSTSGNSSSPQNLSIVLNTEQDSIVGTACWQPTCGTENQVFRIILTGSQINKCNQQATSKDTFFVLVNAVNNPAPNIGHTFYPTDSTRNDTIFVVADSGMVCYDFFLSDTIRPVYLATEPLVRFSNGQSSLSNIQMNYTVITDTFLSGQLCFYPGCELAGITAEIILMGKDTFDCNPNNWVYDTVYVQVLIPENNPPVISHDLAGLIINGENHVLAVPSGQEYCYSVQLEDPDVYAAALIAEGVSDIFEVDWRYGNSANVNITGTNPLLIDVCWTPSCYDSLREFALIVCGRDTSRCGLTEEVCDTVFFYVEECSINIGNVFSPNGDGINDVFVPYGLKGVVGYELSVFDRWGNMVFQDKDRGWNGKKGNKEDEVPEGIYFYQLSYRLWSAKGAPLDGIKTGSVTLLR